MLALLIDWIACTLVVVAVIGPTAWLDDRLGGTYTMGVFLLESALFTTLLGGSFGKLATRLRVVGAVREVLEETGLVAVADRLVWAHATPEIEFENGDRSSFLSLCFRCSWVSGEPFAADDESVDAGWFPVGALPEMGAEQRRRVNLALANAPEAVFAR